MVDEKDAQPVEENRSSAGCLQMSSTKNPSTGLRLEESVVNIKYEAELGLHPANVIVEKLLIVVPEDPVVFSKAEQLLAVKVQS